MRLGAVVVSYNSSTHLGPCLEALLRFQSAFQAGLLVVDNNSTDDSRSIATTLGVPLLAHSENLGFAAAVNSGFRALPNADAVLILNPDTVLTQPPEPLTAELSDPRVAAASGRLIDDNGAPQRGFHLRRLPSPSSLIFENLGLNRLWPSNPVNRSWRYLDLDESRPQDVEQPAGACLLLRRLAWLNSGGLDEHFFPVWFEDVDLCARLLQSGWRLRFSPHFSARHSGGHSVLALVEADRKIYWYGSLLRYATKHFRPTARRLVCLSVILGWILRSSTGMLLDQSSHNGSPRVSVVRLAWAYFRGNPTVTAPVDVQRAAG